MKTLSKIAGSLSALGIPAAAILRIATGPTHGETVTIGGVTFEVRTNGIAPTSNVHINLSGGSTVAAYCILSLNSNVTDATSTPILTLGGVQYQFYSTLPTSGSQRGVKIGGDREETWENFVAAVNAAAGAGTKYYLPDGLAHAVVSADVEEAPGQVRLTARIPGYVAPGAFVVGLQSGVGGGTFSTVGSPILANGVAPTPAETITALVAAIDARVTGALAQAVGTTHILLQARDGGIKPLTVAETLAGTDNGFTALPGSLAPQKNAIPLLVSRTPTAAEVALGKMHFPLLFVPRAYTASVRTSAGAAKAWDGVLSYSAGLLTLDNSGSTDWTATDVVTVLAQA